MEKFKKYMPVVGFIICIAILIGLLCHIILPKYNEISQKESELQAQQTKLKSKLAEKAIVESKIKRMQDSIKNSPKKIYYPIESDLGSDTLFFTLYNDIIEMLHANAIKIKSIDYEYNPESDAFVKAGKDIYFVCDVNMELISNYVNLGKFVQDLYQYPYYIKINNLEVKPYTKDKTVLFSNVSVRLYAHTTPDETNLIESSESSTPSNVLNGAKNPIPQ